MVETGDNGYLIRKMIDKQYLMKICCVDLNYVLNLKEYLIEDESLLAEYTMK